MNFSPKRDVGRHDRAVLLHGRRRTKVRSARAAARSASSRSRRSSSAAPSAAPTRSTAASRKKFPGTDCIHGDMQQGARDRVMKAFRAGEVQDPRGHRRRRPRHRRQQHLAHHQLRHPAVVGRLRPSRRPHRPHGPRRRRLHVRHARRRRRTDADRNADQQLLKRDEIEGFTTVATAVRSPDQRPTELNNSTDAPAEPEEPKPPKPRPPGRRPVEAPPPRSVT